MYWRRLTAGPVVLLTPTAMTRVPAAFTALADVMAALTVVSSVEVPLPLLFGPHVVGSPSVMKSTTL